MLDWFTSLFRGLGSLFGGGEGGGSFDLGGSLGSIAGKAYDALPNISTMGSLMGGLGPLLPLLLRPDAPRMPTTGTSYPGTGGAYQPLPDPTTVGGSSSNVRRTPSPDMQQRGIYSGGVATPEAMAAFGGVNPKDPYASLFIF
jgi:hypothetical protein